MKKLLTELDEQHRHGPDTYIGQLCERAAFQIRGLRVEKKVLQDRLQDAEVEHQNISFAREIDEVSSVEKTPTKIGKTFDELRRDEGLSAGDWVEYVNTDGVEDLGVPKQVYLDGFGKLRVIARNGEPWWGIYPDWIKVAAPESEDIS